MKVEYSKLLKTLAKKQYITAAQISLLRTSHMHYKGAQKCGPQVGSCHPAITRWKGKHVFCGQTAIITMVLFTHYMHWTR